MLILPFIKGPVKEWVYAGFGITLISACVSHWAIDGFTGQTLFPLIIFAILVTSYLQYHKLIKLYKLSSQPLKQNMYVVSSVSQ